MGARDPLADGAFDVVALAASAGGLNAVSRILAELPSGFPAGIVVIQHLDPRHRSLMADILAKRTQLKVKEAEEGETVLPGAVLIAPPNRHLLVNADGTISLTQTELVHFLRPSADLLFESVAASFRDRVIKPRRPAHGGKGQHPATRRSDCLLIYFGYCSVNGSSRISCRRTRQRL